MTIEELEVLAANIYKEAEEDSPILGNTGKKEWMARRLEDIIEKNPPGLNTLLGYHQVDDILNFLDDEYEVRGDEELAEELEDRRIVESDAAIHNETVVANPVLREDPIINPDDKEVNRIIQDRDIRDGSDMYEEKEFGGTQLRDNYINERADQPEYMDAEPEFTPKFQENYKDTSYDNTSSDNSSIDDSSIDGMPIIEEEIIIIETEDDTEPTKLGVGEVDDDCGCKA